jgi:uncharacterized membrane protein (DUF4010 family)
MQTDEVLMSLAVALGIGLLIGLEREQSTSPQDDGDSNFLGGARTYPLVALVGALSALLGQAWGAWVIVLAFSALFALLAIAYVNAIWTKRDRGITSDAAFIMAFFLGVLCVSSGPTEVVEQRFIIAAAIGVTVTILLSLKPMVHGWIHAVSKEDVYSTLKFLLVAVIVLPLLPHQTYGPLDVLNPFEIGLMVALITGISFVGYVAIRLLGPGRAMGLIGLVGGLVSSTAVTLSSANQARRQTRLHDLLAMAVVLASTIMAVRVAVVVGIIYPPLLRSLALPLAVMSLVGLGWAGSFYWRGQHVVTSGSTEVPLTNPVELSTAVKFGLLFAGVLFGAKAANVYLGDKGVYLAGILAGVADVDAITLSMANLVREGLDSATGSITIILGVASNTVVKIVMALLLGGWQFGRRVAYTLGMMMIGGLVTVLLTSID